MWNRSKEEKQLTTVYVSHFLPPANVHSSDKSLAVNNKQYNKWSKNLDKRPHRRLVTPRGANGFVRPQPRLIHGSLGAHASTPQTASRSV